MSWLLNTNFQKKDGHTISLDKAIAYVEEDINSSEANAFCAIKENLLLMEQYRNNIVHYYNEQLEPYIFMVTAKSALNYVDFVKEHFSKDIIEDEGLFIMPLGFKLPFKPEDFLSKKATNYISTEESKKFIDSMLKVITDLEQKGVQDTIVVGFDIYLENVKRLSNSDLLVAITSKDEADANFARITKYQLINDSDAQKVTLSDDELKKKYPLTYKDVSDKCKALITDFKQGKQFNEILNKLKKDPNFAYIRLHNPNSEKSSKTTMYSSDIIGEIEKRYNKNIDVG